MGKAPWIVIAGCLALSLLVLFQVKWLRHSRQLIEEQFDQKVTMALCSAVEQMERKGIISDFDGCANLPARLANCSLPVHHEEAIDKKELRLALEQSLRRYGVDMDFRFHVVPESPQPADDTYCCALQPLVEESNFVEVAFAGKEAYVFQRLGFMTGATIFIFLFVGSVFLMTLLKLVRQKQLHELSVDFFNNLAHEFRTPLTNIRLALNLQNRNLPQAKDNRYLKIIEGESSRLLEQVERLLHVASLGEGEYTLRKEPTDLVELLHEVIRDMNIQAAARGGSICFETGLSAPAIIRADQLHMSNAIRNLIDNALKYCDRTPEVIIRLVQEEEQAILSFSDNGIGMTDKQKELLFEKFRRGSNGNIQEQSGFGLGLAYVKKVTELHNGKIKVESNGRGSIFHLLLPLEKASNHTLTNTANR